MSESETPTKEQMDEAFQNNEPKSFSEGVLAERRDSAGNRKPKEVTVTFKGAAYSMQLIEPPATEIKKIASKGEDLKLDELEEPVDKYLVEPSREELEEALTFPEYQAILIQIIKHLAGAGDEFADQVAQEISERSDGTGGN